MEKKQMVYFKGERYVEVQSTDVFLKDMGSIRCADKELADRLKAIKVKHFQKDGSKRCVISCLRLVELMEEECPHIQVELVGEPDILVEWISVDKHKGLGVWFKIVLVCLVSFFGTAFTIMAYHNDIGINDVFSEVYRMVTNKEPGSINVLEVSYSLGLAVGIIVFYNHIGGRRLTKDPTPIEVAMRNYEYDVDMALIELADREGKEEEVG
ncbi:MAG: stage V sporulation protein AA [Lachnospiraceae bacterium]|nr:stage V sporulation protein AA [Lachnospiraceae bacterium]